MVAGRNVVENYISVRNKNVNELSRFNSLMIMKINGRDNEPLVKAMNKGGVVTRRPVDTCKNKLSLVKGDGSLSM